MKKARSLGPGLLLLAPALAFLVAFRLLPIVDAIRLSGQSWDGFSDPVGVGWANYDKLLHDGTFHTALLHNFEILLALPIWVLLPYGVALALHAEVPGWRFYRLAFFLPSVLSPVVIGLYYGLVLAPEGAFNSALRAIGLGFLSHDWLNDPGSALPVVVAVIIWAGFGAGVLVFLGGLGAVETDQVDAARVDGATWFQVQRHVVFWQMLPVIQFYAVVVIIFAFTGLFPLIFSLTQGGPGYSTYTVDYLIYQAAFRDGDLGYASAMAVVLLAILTVVAVVQGRLLRRSHV